MTLAEQPPPKGATRMALLAGLATGWAVVTEFRPRRRRCSSPWPWCAGSGRGRRWFRQLASLRRSNAGRRAGLGCLQQGGVWIALSPGATPACRDSMACARGLFGVTRPPHRGLAWTADRPAQPALHVTLVGPRPARAGISDGTRTPAVDRHPQPDCDRLIACCSTPPTSTGMAAGATGHAT